MAYNERIADRIREALADTPRTTETKMFGGVAFMVNKKMCVGVIKDDMMCRINPEAEEEALEKKGCRPMDFSHRPMRGFVYVSEEGMRSKKELMYWINPALDFNAIAKASKKVKKKKK